MHSKILGFCLLAVVALAACGNPAASVETAAADLVSLDAPGDAAVADAAIPDSAAPLSDAAGDSGFETWTDTLALPDLADAEPGDVAAADAEPGDLAAADASDVTATCACGDGVCAPACGETPAACPADCHGCGDGVCAAGEGPKVCPIDCCGGCGDGKCTGYDCGESPETCAKDCGTACGNKVCDKGETPATCAEDCAWQVCGNGVCEPLDGGPDNCPQDCKPGCGNKICEKGEDFLGCPVDCGYCGDGFCVPDMGEGSANCPSDCKIGECDPSLPADVTKCDDQNPCTIDQCTPAGSCKHPATLGNCDDGNPCTTGDHCSYGACQLAGLLDCSDGNPCTADSCDAKSGCVHANSGGACSDDNACTLGDACAGGACQPGVTLDCEDGNPCTANACDPALGCTATVVEGIACTDGNLCTTGDSCAAGVCAGTGSLGCDDGNPCSNDLCTPEAGCAHLPNAATCTDGNACTSGDVCVNAVCTPGNSVDCNDNNACTADSCQAATGCTHKASAAACDDGNPCTTSDLCKAGACQGGPALDCDDGNGCTKDACDPAVGCTSTADDGAACSDGNVCTSGDACLAGACVVSGVLGCDDGNPCTIDGCNAGAGCSHKARSGACDDGNACTLGDACWNAVCTGGSPKDCGDGNPCTADSCDAALGCKNVANTAVCSDGDPCTLGDLCAGGACQAGAPANCSDGNPCTDDSCVGAEGCVHLANAATCSDNNVCTVGDACQGGTCAAGAQQACDDGQPCTVDSCSATSGCLHTASTGPCNDGDLCTTGDACVGGACVGGAPLSCTDNTPCTDHLCNPQTGCYVKANDAAACSDGNACTTGDHCSGGSCTYATTLPCDDGLPCTVDSCDTALGCMHVAAAAGAACDDGNLCTTGDSCQGGACVKAGDLNCEDGLPCTTGSCSPASGCAQTPNDAACSDGNPCTTGDHCSGGACVPQGLKDCDDKVACTADSCDTATGNCVHLQAPMDGAACTDGSLCTPTDACLGGVCVGSGSLNCDDGNLCTTDSCTATLGCGHTPRTGSCDDGNLCTTGDACQGGTCAATAVIVCNDNNPCTSDSCNLADGKCVFDVSLLNGTVCSDGDLCTQSDSCLGGACKGSNAVVCAVLDQCHVAGTCAPATGACSNPNKADGMACDDGNACTSGEACGAGKCLGGVSVSCNDNIACTLDSCDAASGCRHDAAAMNGVGCNDGNACTLTDTCAAGTCVGASPVTCTALDQCHVAGTCAPSSGSCSNPSKTDGVACVDGNACTVGDRCVGGACTSTGLLDCTDSDPCTNDFCDQASGCGHTPNSGNSCNDGNVCTINDTCAAGACIGSANGCDDGNLCTNDSCASGTGCVHTANTAPCEDGDACTLGDLCAGTICKAGAQMVCNDNNVCTAGDYCSAGLCLPGAAISCDDGNACTNDACDAAKGCQYSDNGGAVCGDFGVCGGGQCACPGGFAIQNGHCPPVLSGIAIAGASLSPTFDMGTTSYAATVALASANPNVTVTAPPGVAVTLSVNGGAITTLVSGQAAPAAARLGQNTLTITAIHAGMAKSYVVTLSRLPTVQQAYIKATNTDAMDQFGGAIAFSGDTLVVGAMWEDSGATGVGGNQADNAATDAGSAYVYRRSGSTWTFEAYLKGSNTGAGDHFGASVGIDGDTVVVGATNEDSSPASVTAGTPDEAIGDCGAAYVFKRRNGQWSQRAMLKAPDAAVSKYFGTQVVVSGSTIAVSAINAHQAYVFTEQNGVWTLQAEFTGSNITTGIPGGFGASMGLSGDTLVVGAPAEDSKSTGVNGNQSNTAAMSAGAAYVFVRSGSTWSQQAYLKASNTESNDYFGFAVGISGDTIVVGAEYEDGNGLDQQDNSRLNSGAAYVFVRSAGAWSQQAYLKSAAPYGGDQFGSAVAIKNDWILIGAKAESGGSVGVGGDQTDHSQPAAGAAYLFSRSGTSWLQSAYLKASNTDASDTFGTAVAFDGNTAVVGAPMESSNAVFGAGGQADNSALDAGAVYVFSGDACFFNLASECDDSNGCSADSCGSSQMCQHAGAANGATCDGTGTCQASACVCPAGFALSGGMCWPVLTQLATNAGVPLYLESNIPATQSLNSGSYGLSVPFATASMTVTASAVAGTSLAVSVNGGAPVALTSGVPSSAIALAGGTTTVTVAASSGGLTSYYAIGVARPWASQSAYVKASNPNTSDVFGSSLAIDGDTMVIGASGEHSCSTLVAPDPSNIACAAAGAAYVFVRQGGVWTQQAYLKASNTDANDLFGSAVAISGDTIVIGAPWEDANAAGVFNGPGGSADNSRSMAGAAYVFVRSGTTWTQQAYLKAPVIDANDYFGQSVAISGDTVVVGAYGESSNAGIVNGTGGSSDNSMAVAGAAYVFTRSAGLWSQQAFLKASVPDANDHFGLSVAVANNTVVVGAWGEQSNATGVLNGAGGSADNSANQAGAAYVFTRSGVVWSQQAYLKASNTDAGDSFGVAVAVSGDTIVVGAVHESSNATGALNGVGASSDNSLTSAGAAYVFLRSGTTWGQQAYLKAANPNANDNFGYAVALSGDTVLVGAYGEDGGSPGMGGNLFDNSKSSSGAAYAFTRAGSTWIPRSYIKASNPDSSDLFGQYLALSGTTAVVGADAESSNASGINGNQADNSMASSGAAYVFTVFGP